MKTRQKTFSQEYLKSILEYNPETGDFFWKVSRIWKVKVGDKAGSKEKRGYIIFNIQGTIYTGHRLAFLYMTGEYPEKDIDHINGNKSDNSWANLRLASRTENFFNAPARKNNTSGYKGVSFDKSRKKYIASAQVANKTKKLGRFNTAIEAHNAYVKFAEKNHGEFIHQSVKEI